MDINNSYQTNNNASMHGNSVSDFDYDLKLEKQKIKEITEEVKEELLAKWRKSYANAQIFPAAIEAMHPEVVNFLLSFDLVGVYDNIARQTGLDASGRNELPKIVWRIAQSKKWNDLEQVLETQIPLVQTLHKKVINLLQQDILNKVRMLGEKPFVKKVSEIDEIKKQNEHLMIVDALNQFPNLAEQNLTLNQLKLRTYPTPVRPSIKNWIADYRDNFGAGKHSPIDRGNFLFHSENGKTLSTFDRQRLGAVLKSLDEGTVLTIDPGAQKIVFENMASGMQRSDEKTNSAIEMQTSASANKLVLGVQPGELLEKKIDEKKEEKVANFFQMPQSKPPIGSEDFHVLPKADLVAESKIQNYKEPAKIPTARKMPNILMPEDKVKWQQGSNSAPPQSQPNRRNMDDLSDEMLFQRLQEKKVKTRLAQNAGIGGTQGFTVGDNVSFSSPQKFDSEQKTNSSSHSLYHIAPRSRESEKQSSSSEFMPKIQGNVVDLKG